MNLARVAVDRATVTWFAAALILISGIASYFALGQLEDPEFTVKTAIVSTTYPGASPWEVEEEVTDALEIELQKLKELDSLESYSRAGWSRIKVNIKASYTSEELPAIWEKVRARVDDAVRKMPSGVNTPQVIDDFGDVFGLLIALTSDGFSPRQLKTYADEIKRELSLIDGVARVDLWGVQDRVIYLDVRQSQLVQLGISESTIARTLATQNAVVDGGELYVGNSRIRVAPTGTFEEPDEISGLVLQPDPLDLIQSVSRDAAGRSDDLIRLGDVGDIREGYRDPPVQIMRYNGKPAIGIAITNRPGENVVDVGKRVDQRLGELARDLPIGIEVEKVNWQSQTIDDSVRGFFISLFQAVAIVLACLTIPMGWRMGVVIGTALVLTVLATFLMMAIFGIDLQRMSLGALVIALGMMVDNAIVVADGYSVRASKGMDPRSAAIEAASQPSMPLLGATVIAVMAFYPIFASEESAGEYCATLFSVVAISLMVSWLISMTLTPLQCMAMLKPQGEAGADPYGGRFYVRFRQFLHTAIRFRFITIGAAVAMLIAALGSFGGVTKLFFPDAAMPKFMIDYWAAEGTRIERVSADLERIEEKLAQDPRVADVAAFVGGGPPRFYLPVEPEAQNSAYGQLIVNVHEQSDINDLIADIEPWLTENFADALMPLRKFGVGPGDTWKFELRISGPGDADAATLRGLADDVLAILHASPYIGLSQTDWRQTVLEVRPDYNAARASWASITREDIARTTRRFYDGLPIGLFRDGDELVPIVMRNAEDERAQPGTLDTIGVRGAAGTRAVPLSQVVDSIDVAPQEAVVARYDRRRTITVQANARLGDTFPTLYADVVREIEAIELPPGYRMEWGGERENSTKSQMSLIPGVIPALAITLFIMVALFNAMRPPLVIILTIPFVMVGVVFGLLFTGVPFGFVALLAAMSLAGMMIKNGLVLLDEIEAGLARGLERYEATIEAAVSRLRPVVLAAATTVLGVIPLLQDVFWVGLAVTIMAGLSFGTLLTMVLVPTLYATLYRLRRGGEDRPPDTAAAPTEA
ncbi:efflux RND transporter permease subunit [Limibaculum sp. M0105]|uniref:Efflux RND transporter permease subunit n=1 Tax=Thermohalobaculum xanthum TaxID=2753746 RepID=A0A8J7M8T3_9RHOB|nr:efflux RND transporter permease subunit [Thermohalobaculum xanthum]MBK0400431.1 efflux RND transporter permease subunit [Thermohalobaculum xanthum]